MAMLKCLFICKRMLHEFNTFETNIDGIGDFIINTFYMQFSNVCILSKYVWSENDIK